MIALRRSELRNYARRPDREAWRSLTSLDPSDARSGGFGALERLNEEWLAPGVCVTFRFKHATELITYVQVGALIHEYGSARASVTRTGEFQCVALGPGLRHTERNASACDVAHVFRFSLRASQARLAPRLSQQRFSTADRRGSLCLVASPDAERGSLRIHQNALVYSALLDPGRHVVHALSPGRGAWLHVVSGAVRLVNFVLQAGDGAALTDERALSVTALTPTEILMFDLTEPLPRFSADEVS
jgi:redox-sensitive bicupin YhaK (pirin superfamily)